MNRTHRLLATFGFVAIIGPAVIPGMVASWARRALAVTAGRAAADAREAVREARMVRRLQVAQARRMKLARGRYASTW